MKSSKKALYMFLVGFALVGICIRVKTGISTAYSKSENGGLTEFLVYRINSTLCGERFSLDLFFNPIGYLLMLLGIKQLGDRLKNGRKLAISVAIAMILSLVTAFLPLYISNGVNLVKCIICLYIIEGIVLLIAITTFVNEVKSKVDGYYNMEVGKDLTFATELFFFAYFAMIVAIFLNALGFYFSKVLLALDYIGLVYSVMYFVYKTSKYNRELKIFE